MQTNPRSFAFVGVIVAGYLALPVGAQTVTPSSGVWSTTTSGTTVTTSTVTVTTPPPFAFSFNQPTSSGSYPATVNATLMGPGNWATNTYTYNGPIYQFLGAGTRGSTSTTQQGYIVGPAFSASIASGAGLWNTGASFAPPTSTTALAGTPSLLTISSNGAPGADPGNDKKPGGGSYNAGAGGNVSITQNATLLLSVANTAIPSSVNLSLNPWTPIGSALLASSQGGVGSDPVNTTLEPGAGGAGGAISLTTSAASRIAIANNASSGTVNGITALSTGNYGGIYSQEQFSKPTAIWGTAGAGGAITLTHNGSISDTTSLTSPFNNSGNLIGIALASLGGSSLWPSDNIQVNTDWSGVPPNTGSGGAINATLASGAAISLTSGNAIGMLAVSEPGDGALAMKSCKRCGWNTSYFGSGGAVSVLNNGSIATGSSTSLFSAGLLAISSGSGNLIDPFGSSTVSVGAFGFGGPVSVSNSGSINSTGSLSVGMAGLSLGAAGIATNAGSGANTLGNNGDYGGSTSSTSAGSTGSVSLSNSGTITTLGDSAFGMVALATPSGGLLRSDSNTVFGSSTTSFSSGQSVGNSASPFGANGGSVTVSNSGSITTGSASGGGNMAIGILGQSVGGGGGSTGGKGAAAFVGDSGGSGGNGGTVSITSSGTLTTFNDGAIGLLSQSVGGGGGNGGNAAGVFVAVGGQGGLGGSGGAIDLSLGAASGSVGAITTSGDFAAGVLAHSVGGGGGNGGYAKSVGLFVSNAIGGAGGGGGSGGAVSFANNGQPLSTSGNGAHGVLLQSIGGGGGNGGGALSHAVGVLFSDSMALGGSGGSGGAGGSVSATSSGAITTSSPDAMGLVAQSIGGGGGGNAGSALAKSFATAGDPDFPTVEFSTAVGGKGGSGGAGGTVNVSTSGALTTAGSSAFGLLAQSIGGGGGFLGDPSLALQAPVSNSVPFVSNKDNNYANGGTVTLNLGGNITTTGSNAHGVVAQSIGGGGGVAGGYRYDPNAQLVMGNAYQFNNSTGGTSYSGGGNSISINQSGGTINTSGDGSIGILAQSSGGITSSDVNPYLINIAIAGTVSGGKRGGSGILVSGGGNTSSKPNTITVNSGGLITSADGVLGTAIQANSGYTNVTINSGGTVSGSVDLGSTPGDLSTNAGGTFNAGLKVVVVANTFSNAGNLFPAGIGRIGTTTITGGFVQTASGLLGVDVNFLGSQASDQLIVNGQAQLGGTIVPLASALLPGSLPVVSATSLSGTVQVRNGIAFGWTPSLSNNSLTLTPQPTFRPAWLPISPSQNSFTRYLEQAWINSDRFLAPSFGYLSQLSTGSQYMQVLQAMAPQAHTVQMQNLLNTAPFALGSSIDCPADLSSKLLQLDVGCVWVRGAGTWANQAAQNGDPGSSLTGASTWLGGQRKLAPGWFLGGALGYGQSWADASNSSGSFSSNGDVYSGSLTLRHVHKAWSFSGSLAFASGDFQNSRSYLLPAAGSLPGSSGSYRSRVSPWLIGGRLRAAYTIPLKPFFLRPYLDVDLLHAEMPGFVEYGTSGLPLSFSTSQKTALLLSPMLEFGGQKQLDASTNLRLYLALGLSVRPDFNWAINTNFRNAYSGNGSYQLFGNAPDVVGRVNLGLQVLKTDGFELHLEYELTTGDGYVAQIPSAKFTYRF